MEVFHVMGYQCVTINYFSMLKMFVNKQEGRDRL